MANHCIDCDYCGEDMRGTTMPMCKSLERAKDCYLYRQAFVEAERAALTEDYGNNEEFLTDEDKKWHQSVVETANQLDAFRYLRPEVLAFAHLMEQQLRANDHKGGWDEDHPRALLSRLREETDELDAEVPVRYVDVIGACRERIAKEAADVANFAMMIADVCGALSTPAPASGDMGDRA